MSTPDGTTTTEEQAAPPAESTVPAAPQDVKEAETTVEKVDEKVEPQDKTDENGDKKEESKEETPAPEENKAEDLKEDKPEEPQTDDKKEEKAEEEVKTEEKAEEPESKPDESKEETKVDEIKEEKTEIKEDETKPEEKKEEETKEESMDVDKDDKMETDATPKKEPEEDKMETETPKQEESKPEEVVVTPSRVRQKLGDFLATPGGDQTPSGKRQRKSVERHEPESFKEKSITHIPGRGKKLAEIPSVEKLISKRVRTDPGLKDAYKLLYGFGRKRIANPKVGSVKRDILDYSGFLHTDASTEEDEVRMEKFKVFALKQTLPTLREICDLLDIDRSGATKDVIVDRLADFLSVPDAKYTKSFAKAASKKKGTPDTKKRKTATPSNNKGGKRRKKTDHSDVTEDKPEDDESGGGGEDPSEKELREWVHHYVNCFNLDKATTKHAIETVSDKFNKDLSHKKTMIKELLAEELNKGE